jgi:hypothetical protein
MPKIIFLKRPVTLVAGLFLLFSASNSYSQSLQDFKTPDASNRPITYWMWLNGNITKSGITKDLETMKSVGINGTLFFSVGFYQPGPVKFMSDEWWDDVAFAMKESDRLKMKFGIYNSDGWSMSGGPWITPEQSMKVLTWSDTTVTGGKVLSFKLPAPPKTTIYKDVAVTAFPALPNDKPIHQAKIVASTLVNDAGAALDNDAKSNIQFLKAAGGKIASMTVDFAKPTDLRRIVFDQIKADPFLEAAAELEYSINGREFFKVADSSPLNLKAEGAVKQITFTFPKITARFVRLSIKFQASTMKPVPISQESVNFGTIRFYSSPRMNLWEPKSGETKRIRHESQTTFMKELNAPTNEVLPTGSVVNSRKQIDLTSLVNEDGVLNWEAPAGDWIIQRIGYTSTGRVVNPSTKEGKGLECNKMDAKAVETHFNAYTGKFIDLSNKIRGRPIDCIQMESWEAGIQNWTEGFEKEFQKRNGYSILPYMPVLAGGYVVNSYEESNKFLWDFRNTVSQLIAENYWGTMYRMAKERGVTVSGEGSGMQHYLYDPMRYQQYLDIPMGEFWPNEGHARADVKNASSVAHTYGRPLSGAESFTSGDVNLWSKTPYDLKQIGDEAFTLGNNYLVMHTYVHQPYDIAPGFTLSKFGNHLQRLNPWFSQSQGWFNYFARCQYMLRQGRSIQDIAYFTGEGIPSYLGLPWELHPKLPEGYDYDGVNTDIIKRMTVENGLLCLPTGAQYRLLVFQDVTTMTPELAKEVKRLVAAGANVLCLKPGASPSLQNQANADQNLKEIANEVWGNIDGKKVKQRVFGKGRVYSGTGVEQVLKQLNSVPDFVYASSTGAAKVNFVHRQTAGSDVYFLANYEKSEVSVKARFRVSNRVPELWDPDKGTGTALPYTLVNKDQIEVPLHFDALGSAFVVFKEQGKATAQPYKSISLVNTIPLDSTWQVEFRSSADSLKTSFQSLTDWSKNKDPRIKYFSGSAHYVQEFQLPAPNAEKVELNLGEVNKNMAKVLVNGQEAAFFWKPPYKVDITQFLKSGSNRLEIVVTNTATNSLVGDERFPADITYEKNGNISKFPSWLSNPIERQSGRRAFVTYKYIDKDSSLDPSGLVGPVVLNFFK